MSFALDYRKKMQAREARAKRRKKRGAKANTGFVVMPVKKSADTAGNRRRVLAALSLAAMILLVFNSGAMVIYAGGLATTKLGLRVAQAADKWHALMEESRMTGVVEEIRGIVSAARFSTWQDFAVLPVAPPPDPYTDSPDNDAPVLPASGEPPVEESDPEPEIERTQAPVMKAEATRQ